jgi:hypothetical protein
MGAPAPSGGGPGPSKGGGGGGNGSEGGREAWTPPRPPDAGAESWAPSTEPPPPAGDPAQLTVIPDPTPYAMPDPTPVPPPDWSTPETRATAPPIGGGDAPPIGGGAGQPPGHEPPAYAGEPPAPGRPTPYVVEPPRRSDQRLWLILGALAVLLSCCCVAAGLVAVTWGRQIIGALGDRQRTVGLDQTIRDGDLEFRVYGVECGIDRVGDPFVSQSAVGQFCVAKLAVRNVGSRPALFSDVLQRAYGPSGQRFVADTGAGLLANADQQVFLSDINPGNEVTGAVVYDVPPRARIVRLELHESPGSRGAIVKTG